MLRDDYPKPYLNRVGYFPWVKEIFLFSYLTTLIYFEAINDTKGASGFNNFTVKLDCNGRMQLVDIGVKQRNFFEKTR